MNTLETARKERERLAVEIDRLDKVIAFLTGSDQKPAPPARRPRHQTPEARQKMRAAWALRKRRKKISDSQTAALTDGAQLT